VEKFLKEQLSLKKLACARLKTKCNIYSSFHVSVLKDEFPLINNTGVWLTGCLIAPFYGRLTSDQVYSPSRPPIGDPSPTHPHNPVSGGNPVSPRIPTTIEKNGTNSKGYEEASGGSY
jgi:hypothetical protein